MIHSITITNHKNESLELVLKDPYETGIAVESVTGLGPPSITVETVSLASADGALFGSTKAESRNIVFTFRLLPVPTIEDVRQKLYKYFPVKKEIAISIRADNRVLGTNGYIETAEPDIFSDAETMQISLICPDPWLYDLFMSDMAFVGVEPMFEFPFSTEVEPEEDEDSIIFGEIHIDTTVTFNYNGDVDTGFVIIIHALDNIEENITIYNQDTRATMTIDMDMVKKQTGRVLQTAEDIIISTIPGDRFIRLYRDGIYTNIIGSIGRNSDWFILDPGVNSFAFAVGAFGSENSKNLVVTFNYRNAFQGV